MLVGIPVWSMKIRRCGSSPCWLVRQVSRASPTSGRSCSAARTLFFEADAMTVEKPPHRTNANGQTALFAQTHRHQRRITRTRKSSE